MHASSSADQRRRTTPPHTARPWPLPVVPVPATVAALLQRRGLANLHRLDRTLEPTVDPTLEPAAAAPGRNGASEPAGVQIEPIVTESDDPAYRIVTFLAENTGEAVYLQANKLVDRASPHEAELQPLEAARFGTDLRGISLRMPHDWICTYHLATAEGVRLRGGVVVLDGAPALPQTQPITSWRRTEDALVMPASGEAVTLTVRSHPHATSLSPVVLLTDGEDWLSDELPVAALAAHIAAKQIPPLHVAYLPAASRTARQIDYTADRAAQEQLFVSILRILEVRISAHHPQLIPAGQSLGGLFSLLAAVRLRGLVRAAVAQSPSLWWPTLTAPYEHPGEWFVELGRVRASAPSVLQVGRTEWVLQRSVLHAREFLRSHGALVETPHDIITGGHDRAWWRRTLAAGIVAALHNT